MVFNLEGLDSENILTAVLNTSVISTTQWASGATTAALRVYEVPNEWTEQNTDGATKVVGTYKSDTCPALTDYTLSSTDTQMSIDLTTYIKNCLQENKIEASICIGALNTNSSDTKIYIYSKESTVEGTQPYLQVTTLK